MIPVGNLYIPNMRGIVQCFDLETGDMRWRERQTGTEGKSETWSSLVLCGDTIYHLNQAGDTFVFRASPDYQLLSTNSLQEQSNSSIAVSDGDIFIRTHKSLWCIGYK